MTKNYVGMSIDQENRGDLVCNPSKYSSEQKPLQKRYKWYTKHYNMLINNMNIILHST